MFGIDPAKLAVDYLNSADLNHNGIADKVELMPVLDSLTKAGADMKKAIDIPKAGAAFSKVANALETMEKKSAVKLVDGLQFSDLLELVKDEEAQKAIVQGILGFKQLVDAIDRPQAAVAFADLNEGWQAVEKYKAADAKKKK